MLSTIWLLFAVSGMLIAPGHGLAIPSVTDVEQRQGHRRRYDTATYAAAPPPGAAGGSLADLEKNELAVGQAAVSGFEGELNEARGTHEKRTQMDGPDSWSLPGSPSPGRSPRFSTKSSTLSSASDPDKHVVGLAARFRSSSGRSDVLS